MDPSFMIFEEVKSKWARIKKKGGMEEVAELYVPIILKSPPGRLNYCIKASLIQLSRA